MYGDSKDRAKRLSARDVYSGPKQSVDAQRDVVRGLLSLYMACLDNKQTVGKALRQASRDSKAMRTAA